MPGTLRGDHDHVQVLARANLFEMNVEPVRERQCGALAEVGFDLLRVKHALVLIRRQHHHDVGSRRRLSDSGDLDPGFAHLRLGGGAGPKPDHDRNPGVLEIVGVGVSLGAIADDRHRASLHDGQIRVLVVKNLHSQLPCRRDTPAVVVSSAESRVPVHHAQCQAARNGPLPPLRAPPSQPDRRRFPHWCRPLRWCSTSRSRQQCARGRPC